MLISGSADKCVKLWDLRNTAQALTSFKVENTVEDFCLFDDKIIIAQGPTLTLAKVSD